MDIDQAILSFAQSEKIKAGLIWSSQALDLLQGLSGAEKSAAEKVVGALLNMIVHEIELAKNVVENEAWDEMTKAVDRALVMIRSGVGPESTIHLSQALSRATTIGHQSMSMLKEKGLI